MKKMVRLKAVHIITDDGFTIYNQSFGATEQDQDMVGSLIAALTSFSKEAIGENLSSAGFGEADLILESSTRLVAIVVAILDREHKEREEFTIRRDLLKFVKIIEDRYAEELEDPIFQKSAFSDVGTMIFSYFFRDKMSRIYHKQFASINEYIQYPKTLLFEITTRGAKLYTFYREYPKFTELLGDISKDEFDQLIYNMQDKNSMVSFQDCIDRFGESNSENILELFKYLTNRGMFDAFNVERIDA
jgi:hypothetical protein